MKRCVRLLVRGDKKLIALVRVLKALKTLEMEHEKKEVLRTALTYFGMVSL